MARYSLAARRYAKSLLALSKEDKNLEAVAADMALISSTVEASDDLRIMLRSPVIKADKKLAVLNEVFGGHIGTVSLRFVEMIARKQREALLFDIASAFTELYRREKGIVSAEITTAVGLNEQERQMAIDWIARVEGGTVELTEKVDPSIIGGFVIRIEGRQYDDSIAGRLQDMRLALTKDTYITDKQNNQNG